MRILFLTSRLPYPPNRGDRLRAYHFLKELSTEHQITLLSFIAGASELEHVDALRPYCRDVRVLLRKPHRSATSVLLGLWRREPLQALYYRSGEMQRLVDQVLVEGQFDVVYTHLFRMAPYVERRSHVYRVVDLTDAISLEVIRSLPYRSWAWRLIYGMDRPRIERYERHVARTVEETWLISEVDRLVLAERCPDANILVVTNGVDLDRFYPTGQPHEPNSLVFVGHLQVFHNVDAVAHLAQDILPLVAQDITGCTLTIVGADPSSRVRELGSNPAITVTGFVEDLNDYLNRSAVFVAPLRFSAGVQNKVLEAMAAARPVITTSIVNEGLGARAGEDLLVADDAQTIAGHAVSLLRDESLRTRIGRAGREFVRQEYSWQHVVDRMRAIEDKIISASLRR